MTGSSRIRYKSTSVARWARGQYSRSNNCIAPVGKGDGQLQIEAQIKYQLPVEGNLSCAGTAKMASKAKKSPSYSTIAYIKEIDVVNSENIENVV